MVAIRLFGFVSTSQVFCFTTHQGSLYQLTSLAVGSFHMVASYCVLAVSVFGKNQVWVMVFWRISVGFCGFRTLITPPSTSISSV